MTTRNFRKFPSIPNSIDSTLVTRLVLLAVTEGHTRSRPPSRTRSLPPRSEPRIRSDFTSTPCTTPGPSSGILVENVFLFRLSHMCLYRFYEIMLQISSTIQLSSYRRAADGCYSLFLHFSKTAQLTILWTVTPSNTDINCLSTVIYYINTGRLTKYQVSLVREEEKPGRKRWKTFRLMTSPSPSSTLRHSKVSPHPPGQYRAC